MDGRDEQFYRRLPEHRRRRRPCCYRRGKRTYILDSQSMAHWPERISERAEFGHQECDLMMCRKEYGKVNVTSLVECVSRFAVVKADKNERMPLPIGVVRSSHRLSINFTLAPRSAIRWMDTYTLE